MTNGKLKGHVEFNQPQVKLVADLQGDEEMREHLDEMKENSFPGSCAVINTHQQENK
ncbi:MULTISPECIES: hypothetical protein [unclassified Paenibacillus]|uniref:hypothetical protein n=1 Tax=unclassified Paenibacillus TaxID=185978 RepID=UPI003629C161